MQRSRIFLLGGIVLAFLVIAAGVLIQQKKPPLNGAQIHPASTADDFQLTDQNGEAYRLSARKGKMILLFFGYTNCPDACPMTMTQFRDIKDALKENADQVEFVLVSVDPEQDSVNRMKEYVDAFDPFFGRHALNWSGLERLWGLPESHSGDVISDDTVDHSTYLSDRPTE
jgi:protein SCO1/2